METIWYMFLECCEIGEGRFVSNPRMRFDDTSKKSLVRWGLAPWDKAQIQAFQMFIKNKDSFA